MKKSLFFEEWGLFCFRNKLFFCCYIFFASSVVPDFSFSLSLLSCRGKFICAAFSLLSVCFFSFGGVIPVLFIRIAGYVIVKTHKNLLKVRTLSWTLMPDLGLSIRPWFSVCFLSSRLLWFMAVSLYDVLK